MLPKLLGPGKFEILSEAFDRWNFREKGEHILFGRNVLCEEQCAIACAAAEADLMSGITIENTFDQITSCNAFHVDLYYCFISERKASISSVAARPVAMLVSSSVRPTTLAR